LVSLGNGTAVRIVNCDMEVMIFSRDQKYASLRDYTSVYFTVELLDRDVYSFFDVYVKYRQGGADLRVSVPSRMFPLPHTEYENGLVVPEDADDFHISVRERHQAAKPEPASLDIVSRGGERWTAAFLSIVLDISTIEGRLAGSNVKLPKFEVDGYTVEAAEEGVRLMHYESGYKALGRRAISPLH